LRSRCTSRGRPARCDGYGFRRPARRFYALRASARRAGEADCSAARPPCALRFASEVCRSTPAPSRTSEEALVRRCFLPWAFAPHDTCQNNGPSPRGVEPRSEPREVWDLLRDHDRRTCEGAFRPLRASSGFTLQGFLLAPVGLPLGSPCPPAVSRVDSPRPLRSVRTRSASGPRSRRRARSDRDALAGPARRCLPGLRPSRAFAPSALANALFASAPSSRVGRERRPVPPASRGLPGRRDRLAPLGAAGSPGICHLATVAAS